VLFSDGAIKGIKIVVGGVTTTMKYDIRGNKIKMNDPDMGTWTYAYNALLNPL
jgi:YD repeat-containing protein